MYQGCRLRPTSKLTDSPWASTGLANELARIFGHRPFRLGLGGLTPSAGSMLFPFLESSNGDVHDSTQKYGFDRL
jgi:hypothetical protein